MADFSKEFLIRVRADIEKAVKDMERLTGEMKGQSRTARNQQTQTAGLSRSLTRLAQAAGAYITVQSAFRALRIADEYKQIQVQLRLATKESGDYVAVSEEIFSISQRNGVALQSTVRLFRSIARAGTELGATNTDVLKVTEAIQQLAIMSGADQTSLANAMLQFGQAMAAGVVRAEEFNSILENTPEVANRIAKGMGLTVGQLRLAVVDGKVLSQQVFQSLLKQAPAIAEEMKDVPDSIGRSAQRMNNALGLFLGQLDRATGATSIVSGLFNKISAVLQSNARFLDSQFGSQANLVDLQQKRLDYLKRIVELEETVARLEAQSELSLAGQRILNANKAGIKDLRQEIELIDKALVEANEQALLQSEAAKAADFLKSTEGKDAAQQQAASQQFLGEVIEDVNARIAQQTALFKDQVKEVERASQRIHDLNASFQGAERQLEAAGTPTKEATGLEIQQSIARARQSLAAGDLEGAVSGAEAARDLIVEVGRAGNESQFVLQYLLEQAKQIGLQAAQGLADQQTGALEQVRTTLLDLQAKAKEFEVIKLGFNEDQAILDAALLRANLQAQFNENPLVIPVIPQDVSNAETPTQSPLQSPPGFAAGGLARGPGSGTSDSLLAFLSNGEFVVRRDAVKHYGLELLNKINAMSLPRFADGGLARLSGQILSEPATAPSGRPVYLTIEGQRVAVSATDDEADKLIHIVNRQVLKRGRSR